MADGDAAPGVEALKPIGPRNPQPAQSSGPPYPRLPPHTVYRM